MLLRRIGFCLFAFMFAVLAFGQKDPSELRVSLSFKKTPIREALSQLFAGRGSVIVSPDIQGQVTGDYRNERFETVLRYICVPADATYRLEGGIYVIVEKFHGPDLPFREPPVLPRQPEPDPTVAITFSNADAHYALEAVLGLFMAPRRISSEIKGTVTVNRKFRNAADAVSWVAESLHCEVSLVGGWFVVKPKQVDLSWWAVKVTLKQDHVDIRDALRGFFRQLDVNYSIAPDVQGTISCDLHGNAVEVLPRLLAAVQSRYRVESGVVMITHEEGRPQPAPKSRVKVGTDLGYMFRPMPRGNDWVVAESTPKP